MTLQIEIPFEEDMIEIYIRPAEPSDSRAILFLLQELERETDYIVFEGAISVEQQRQLITQYKKSLNSLYLVVESDGQFVGMGMLAGHQHPLQRHRATMGLGLLKDYWGLGLGSLLVEEILDFARHSDIEIIALEVVEDNQKAFKLYERYNFKPVGKYHHYLKLDTKTYDAILMENDLSSDE